VLPSRGCAALPVPGVVLFFRVRVALLGRRVRGKRRVWRGRVRVRPVWGCEGLEVVEECSVWEATFLSVAEPATHLKFCGMRICRLIRSGSLASRSGLLLV
jgi:hypothetical protein